ncbi:MAG: hypothetical protein IJC99_04680, partial [Clostridia bacterium]|nr:hypothetical protein [Clostridia bacterium]
MHSTGEKPRFLGTSLLYFVGTVLSKAAVFLLLPLYTAKIPAAALGRMDAATAIVLFAASVIFLDIGAVILRFYLGAAAEEGKTVLATGLCLLGGLLALYLLLAGICCLVFDIPDFPLIALYGLANALLLAAGHVARAVG